MAQRQHHRTGASAPYPCSLFPVPCSVSRVPRSLLAPVVLILVTIAITIACAHAAPAPPPDQSPQTPARADAATIKAEIRDILSDPKYAARRSFLDWLAEKLQSLRPGGIHLPSEASDVVFWTVVAGCGVLVIGLLVHVALTLRFSWLRGMYAADLPGPRLGSEADYRRPFENLDVLYQQLAGQGRFREALGIMMLALLRRHDDLGLLRFHRSKTNGEYVCEYPREHVCRGDFHRFVLAFDLAVYGGRASPSDAFNQMSTLFQRIIIDAGKKPQN